jgi:hypothetical protein
MDEMIKPAETDVTLEVLHEHMELSHYIDVFRESAERVRRVIFIIMVFSVVMLIAQWNTTTFSWVSRHYKGLKDLRSAAKTDADVAKATDGRLSSIEELKNSEEDYRKQRVERVLLVNIPWLGVTFDVNDLGNFCGVAYILLMILLIFSLGREHENLYLALFKVRRLHQHGKLKSDGESTANYLYHALAMSQVLSSPPTLAQWDQPWLKTKILYTIFLVPALVESYVIYEDLKTLAVVRNFVDKSIMYPQYAFVLTNAIIGCLAILYSMSFDRRWRSAFFYINPSLQRVRSRPLGMWFGLRTSPPNQRKMWAQAIERLTILEEPDSVRKPITVKETVKVRDGDKLDYQRIEDICLALEKKAAQAAGIPVSEVSDALREVVYSSLKSNVWTVSARFFGHNPALRRHEIDLKPEHMESIRSVVELLTSAWLEGRHDDLEPLIHPAAVFVGAGLAGQAWKEAEASMREYQGLGLDARVEELEFGDLVIESWGTTAVASFPFTIKYRIENDLYEKKGRELLVLINQGGAWLVVWRKMNLEEE